MQRLYNLYGPTETTVYSTWALFPPGASEPPTIGRPIARILALEPSRVAEIGCGSGLLLFRIAPACTAYTGIDFSEAALHFLRRQSAVPERHLPQVSLLQRTAHELDGLPSEAFDTVVLNSVIQYFPGMDYLVRVLEGAARLVRPGGRIFVGDVRNFRLLTAFHTAVQLHKAPATLSREQLRARVHSHINQEEEPLIDPAFFTALRHRISRIGRVEIYLKRGRYRNELTRFRYDVVLHIGKVDGSEAARELIDWQEQNLTLPAARTLLQKKTPMPVSLLGIPNTRLQTEMRAVELLSTFVAREGRPVAVIAPPAPFPVQVLDLTGLPESEREGEARRCGTVPRRATRQTDAPMSCSRRRQHKRRTLWPLSAASVI